MGAGKSLNGREKIWEKKSLDFVQCPPTAPGSRRMGLTILGTALGVVKLMVKCKTRQEPETLFRTFKTFI